MKLSRICLIALLLAIPCAVRAEDPSGASPVAGSVNVAVAGKAAFRGESGSLSGAASVSPLFAEPSVTAATEASLLAGGIGGVNSRPPKDGKKKPAEPKVETPAVESGNPSAKKAMLYSLLVPGLGQQISGHDERARVFYGIEAAIWTSFVAFRLQGSARRDRYIQFAEFNAGVDGSGKNDDYWRLISRFERSDPGPGSANEFVRRQARALYPEDRAAQDAYFAEHGYFGDQAWDWQNVDNMTRFRQLRTRSLNSYDNSRFSIGLALAHRIVSMIDAARMSRNGGARSTKAASTGQRVTEPGSSPLDHHGRFGMKVVKDGGARVPMLTYKLTF